MCVWALSAAHVPGYWELHLFVKAVSVAAFASGLVCSLYLATEPYVRRHWPDSLISWTRFQARRVRDPLVASHLLLAILVSSLLFGLRLAIGRLLPVMPLPGVFSSLNGSTFFSANLLTGGVAGMILGEGLLLIVVLLRLLIRRLWIADLIAFTVFGVAFVGPGYTAKPELFAVALTLSIIGAVSMLWLLRRFGLLALVAATILTTTDMTAPISLTSWYAGRSLVTLAIPALLAAWALRVIVSAQRRPVTESAG
jgi:hypothetical protein